MIKKILALTSVVLFLSFCLFLSLRSFLRYREDYASFYVASHQIAHRTKLSEEDLEERKLPKQLASDDICLDMSEILGKYVKLGHSIPKGSLFYKTALESDISDLAYTLLLEDQISYDLYANEIRINTSTINDDMYLDIYLTLISSNKPISDLLIRNCRIIGMYDSNGKKILDFDNDSKPYIISIAVEKSDVVILNKALKTGDVMADVSSETYAQGIRSELYEESEVIDYLR